MENEQEIVYLATDALYEISHLETTFQPSDNEKIDGFLKIQIKDNGNNQEINFAVEVKRKLQNAHFLGILVQKKVNENFIVIAESIIPDLRRKLRELNINYLDISGNTYIKYPNLFLFIENNKSHTAEVYKKNIEKHELTKNGLLLVFQLLKDPSLIQATYRKMAEVANISLDSVHKTVHTLKALGYILPLDDKKDYLTNLPKLLEHWVINYETKLKPILYRGRYRCLANTDWRNIELDANSKWGGEAAAEILTDYLKASTLYLYTKDERSELMKKYRLIPDTLGNIIVFNHFTKVDEFNTQTVSPLIVYADLINSTDYRNQETAQIIYEKFVQNKL